MGAEDPVYVTTVSGRPGVGGSTDDLAEAEAAGLARTRWRLGDLAFAGTTVAQFVGALARDDHRTVAVLLRERSSLATALGLLLMEADRLALFAEQLGACCEGAVWPQGDAGSAAAHAIDRIVVATLAYRKTRETFVEGRMAVARADARPAPSSSGFQTAPAGAGGSGQPSGGAATTAGHVPEEVSSHGRMLTVCARCGLALLPDVKAPPCPGTHQGVVHDLRITELAPHARGLYESGPDAVPPGAPLPRVREVAECSVCSARLKADPLMHLCGAYVCDSVCLKTHTERCRKAAQVAGTGWGA